MNAPLGRRGRRVIADSVNTIEGDFALAVGEADMPAPNGWRWFKLTDIARLESGHTPSRQHDEYWNGDIPWIGIPDAREHHGRRIRETAQRVTQAGIDNSAARLLPTDTVCLSRTASVGYVTVMDRPMATSQDFVNWICGPEVDPEFLMHLFLAEKDALLRFGKGSTHTTIYFPEVQAFRVCLPPRVEQRRIVSKLDALRARSKRAKEALDAVPALLDRLRQSILAAAFRGDLTADWREQNPDVEPASELLKRIRVERRKRWEEAQLAKMVAKGKPPKDNNWKAKYVEPEPVDESDLPDPPDGWCWASVDEVCELQLGQQRAPIHTSAKEQYPYVRAANIKWEALDLSDIKTMGFPDRARYRLQPGDVLLSEASGSPTEVGKPAIWRGEIEDCYYQKTLLRARRWSTELPTEWLYTCFLADALLGRFARAAPGVGILHITAERMLPWPVPLAPIAEQNEILTRVRAALTSRRTLAANLEAGSTSLVEVDRAVLATAFRGELLDRPDEFRELTLARGALSRPDDAPTQQTVGDSQ